MLTPTSRLTPRLTLLILSLISAGEIVKGQFTVTPDCGPFYFSLTAAGNVPSAQGYFNEGAAGGFGAGGCTSWTLMYTSVGFTGVTLTLQSAPSATANTPGAYVNFAGTTVTGINPNTSTTGAQSVFGNGAVSIAWIRVNLSGLMGAGTVTGMFYGYKSGAGGGSGGGGVPATAPYNPLVTCPSTLNVSVAAMGNTQLISPVNGQKVTICHFSIAFDSAVDVQIFNSTAACGVNFPVTGVYENILAVALDVPFIASSVGQGICLNVSAATAGGGLLIFGQQ